jgi:hypothetical protein
VIFERDRACSGMRASVIAVLFAACGGPTIAPRSEPPPIANAMPAPPPRSPLAKGTFPVPPQQDTAWAAPAGPLGSAAATLFAQGLADPRGCPYHRIELAMGSVWSGAEDPLTTRGWVLPPRDGKAWAVAWNGLVYPVLSVGAPADLRADVEVILALDRNARAKQAADPSSRFRRFDTIHESHGAAHNTVAATKALLLLRLGEAALAEQMWRAHVSGERDVDPYAELSVEWAWSLFDRAVTAHMRGDVALAVASTRVLAAIQPLVEAEATRRKLRRHDDKAPHLSFLHQLPGLSADAERRARLPAPRNAGVVAPAALAALAPAARVRVLVENLDEVSARQSSQPGGVDLASDPIVEALIAEGAGAVEPLLAVIETDERLTRSVHFHRDFERSRGLLGVHEAAYVAVAGILETDFFRAASTGDNLSWHGAEGRRKVASAIRAHWEAWKTVPLEEHWYRVLADDAAKPDDWLAAAGKITRPSNVRVHPSSTVFQTTTTTSTAAPPKLRGEALRGHIAPSVSALFEKRLRGASVELAGQLALAYARWEPGAAATALRDQTARAIAAGKVTPDNQKHARLIIPLVERRVELGDTRALDDYAAWIRTTRPTADGWRDKDLFALMWEHAAHPSIAAASEVMFADDGAWMPLLALAPSASSHRRSELIVPELLAAPGFRKHVLRALADRRVAGTLAMKSASSAGIAMHGGWHTSDEPAGDPLAPAPKSTVDIRVCDHYAWVLSDDKHPFRPYWPLAARDKAIAALAAKLKAQP